MKRCQICGSDVESNLKICPVCSSEIDDEYVDLYQVYKDSVNQALYEEEKEKEKNEIFIEKDSFIKKTKKSDDDFIVKKK